MFFIVCMQVDMETHAGYMAGMQKEFVSCSMPYYATSSEEVLFHVATRMNYKTDQKVRKRRKHEEKKGRALGKRTGGGGGGGGRMEV